jgi:hypothetical protein
MKVGMTVGRSMARTASGDSGGSSDEYLFREGEEVEQTWHGLENITLKRGNLAEVHELEFGSAVQSLNEVSGEGSPAYQAKLAEYIQLKDERKTARKEFKEILEGSKEEIALQLKEWDKENRQPQKPKLQHYRQEIKVETVEYFKQSEMFGENYSMEFIPRLGSQADYNTHYVAGEKKGEPTGLTKQQAIENRETGAKILEQFSKRWEEEFPNLKFYTGVIHQDRTSPHMHMKVVPVADYSDAKEGYKGPKKAPGFHRALRQMGYEPNMAEIREYKLKNDLDLEVITDKDLDYSTFVQFKKKADSILEQCANEHGWEREIKGVKNSGKSLEHDMYMKNLATAEAKMENKVKAQEGNLKEISFDVVWESAHAENAKRDKDKAEQEAKEARKSADLEKERASQAFKEATAKRIEEFIRWEAEQKKESEEKLKAEIDAERQVAWDQMMKDLTGEMEKQREKHFEQLFKSYDDLADSQIPVPEIRTMAVETGEIRKIGILEIKEKVDVKVAVLPLEEFEPILEVYKTQQKRDAINTELSKSLIKTKEELDQKEIDLNKNAEKLADSYTKHLKETEKLTTDKEAFKHEKEEAKKLINEISDENILLYGENAHLKRLMTTVIQAYDFVREKAENFLETTGLDKVLKESDKMIYKNARELKVETKFNYFEKYPETARIIQSPSYDMEI